MISVCIKGMRLVFSHNSNYLFCVLIRFPVDENGTMSSIIEYFNRRYKYELRHLNWPCLQVGSDRKPTYLPMEVVFFTSFVCELQSACLCQC